MIVFTAADRLYYRVYYRHKSMLSRLGQNTGMPYYPTLAEDIARARQILERGRSSIEDKPEWMTAHQWEQITQHTGTICGADIDAAYRLLESFVAVIETMGKAQPSGSSDVELRRISERGAP